jgi:small subunit ribosomal protein S1
VEGLLHVSEMSWSQHLRSPKDFLKEGQEIECVILNIDREERKMSLGMKQLAADPWADIEFKYPVQQATRPRCATSPTSASSPSWRRAWMA